LEYSLQKLLKKFIDFFNTIAPQQGKYSWSDRLRVSLGVGITILVIAVMNHLWGDMTQDESMVTAVFGVSALCIFLFPNSKFFAPLTLIEANLLASCVAFICVYLIPSISLGIPFAVISTVVGMYLLDRIHPPAVFLSIVIVLAGTNSYDFALHPVLANSIVLALASYLNQVLIKGSGD
jgi:CBS domain-containing membrane protein